MVVSMRVENEICPTLKAITFRLGDFNVSQNSDLKANAIDNEEGGWDISSGNYDTGTIDHDDDMSVDCRSFGDLPFQSHHEDNTSCTSYEADEDDRFEKVSTFLFQGLGFTSKENTRAGPDHWKYSRPKGSEEARAAQSRPTTKRSKKENHAEHDLDFTASLDKEFPDIFAVPRNLS